MKGSAPPIFLLIKECSVSILIETLFLGVFILADFMRSDVRFPASTLVKASLVSTTLACWMLHTVSSRNLFKGYEIWKPFAGGVRHVTLQVIDLREKKNLNII